LPSASKYSATTCCSTLDMTKLHYYILPLSFGAIGIVWRSDGIARLVRVFLPHRELSLIALIRHSFPQATEHVNDKVAAICERFLLYDRGKEPGFTFEDLEFTRASVFYRAVWKETFSITFGAVVTYGGLAIKIGTPRAARAVGTALSRNPFPLIVPCHRVIKSDGTLGNFTSGGTARKRQLLEKEGFDFDCLGRIVRERPYKEKAVLSIT
jgi:methylated-DNA-[protein]-cysteine S-methyltransferase